MKRNYPDAVPHIDKYYSQSAVISTPEFATAMNELGGEYGGVMRSHANRNYDYSNLTPNTSARPGMSRNIYEYYRPGERLPCKPKEKLKWADDIYDKVGIIRNIIDLMGDFSCQGIRVSHPDKRIEKFYKNWWKKVNGPERSERFSNQLYRMGNIVIRRQTAVVNLKQRAQLFRSAAKPDIKIEKIPIKKAEIPWRYQFLNPCTVELVGEDLACFADKKQYMIKFPPNFRARVGNITQEEKRLLADLPKDMVEAIKKGGDYILPQEKTLVFHYKKDDWESWASPMTYAILDDIMLLEKLKLADLAALDGAISNIRIFKLGSLEPLIIPGKAAAAKLKEILGAHTAAGTIDIVWGPDIELIESKSEVYKFLGQTKYEPVMSAIFGGMGVPATLTGTFGTEGTTNNFISLQTLIQRLEYGRSVLLSFWLNELEMVQKAMGFPEGATIEFDYMNLGDEAAEKALLFQMVDRNLISDELLQQKFKHNVAIESERIKREDKERQEDSRLEKVGAYHESRRDEQLKRIALQKGYIKPEEFGVSVKEIAERVRDKTVPKEPKVGPSAKKPPGRSGQGRPKNSRDTTKRKTKTFRPKAKASIELWAVDAQAKIAEVMNPLILKSYAKKNMRSLTDKQVKAAERIKFGVLFSMEPQIDISEENILRAFESSASLNEDFYRMYREILNYVVAGSDGRNLTFDEMRSIQRILYSEINSENI